ncbi:MAG: type I DNA topoisomerase, partial [Zetaproteobacteria bacterium]
MGEHKKTSAVVVVESPAKARTIEKYLGRGYKVLATYGHVRDLPKKNGSVDPEHDFAMIYEELADRKKRIDAIAEAVARADKLILATDPDREGEAIAWHLLEVLKARGVLEGKTIERITFHEITKKAVQEALAHPRGIDQRLVDAQQARRALDYLVGFHLSPVLWRRIRGGLSAGRVQSAALRLICEREEEIRAFKPREYWTVEAELAAEGGRFTAELKALDGRKLGKFDLANEEAARRAAAAIENADRIVVARVERKQRTQTPPAPFITSTLQMEAARKLGFSAAKTMQIAQRLYEGLPIDGENVGLITYMRTDSVALADEAVAAIR